MNEIRIEQAGNKRHQGTQFSVIIPAHNSETTLRRAVESVFSAMDGDSGTLLYEILIIENTSEDGTWQLALQLQAEHPGQVRAFQCLPGVSNGRNKGLEEACGEWVLFLDADDYFLQGAGEVFRDAVHFTGTDLIVCSYQAGAETVHICAPGGERFSGGDLTRIRVRMMENPTRFTSVWGKIFRRACIERGHFRFDPSLRLSEDSHFLIRCLSGCRRIRLFDRPFYHYSTDNGSAVRTFDGTKEEGYRRALDAVRDFLRTQPQEIRSAGAAYGMMQFNLLMVREVFSAANPMSWGQKVRTMERISREEPFASALAAYDPARHKGARFLPIRFLRRGPAAGAAAIYAARVLQNERKEKKRR